MLQRMSCREDLPLNRSRRIELIDVMLGGDPSKADGTRMELMELDDCGMSVDGVRRLWYER